jgi:hypothetical protein
MNCNTQIYNIILILRCIFLYLKVNGIELFMSENEQNFVFFEADVTGG